MIEHPLVTIAPHFKLPFPLYPFQADVVEEQVMLPGSGIYMDVGTGKTVVSTVMALYKGVIDEIDHVLVIMPPVLLKSWSEWLSEIPGLSQLIYRGTPKQREAMDFNVDFVLVSTPIFRNDYSRLEKFYRKKRTFVIVDEATSIRNVSTKSHKRFRRFIEIGEQQFTLLTGTAISSPAHCYGYIKLLAPNVYRSKRHFDSIHVADVDFFGQVTEWQNLDLLSQNFMLNSVRVLADDVLDLPETVYSVLNYELAPAHLTLYKKLAEEKLLLLPDGGKIDATQAQSLYNDLQKIVINPDFYAGKPMRPAGFDVLDTTLDELGADKLIVFNNYRMSNRATVEYLISKGHDAVACYGEVGRKKQEDNLHRFLHDPKCKILVASPESIGIGLNLQKACRCILFMEMPITPASFTQAVGRVRREGQKRKILIRLAVAFQTIQYSLHRRLVSKDDLIQMVSPNKNQLRSLIFGGKR